MKALLLDGSEREDAPLSQAGDRLMEKIARSGRETLRARLRDLSMDSCKGCFHCWATRPGVCGMKDDATVLTQCLAQSDLFVVLTPVTFGGCSSLVKQALERVVLPILLPYFDCVGGEIHHPLRYGTPIRLLAVGALPDKDPKSEEIFRAVFSRNAKNLHSPALGTTFVYDGMSAQEIEEDMKRLVLETGVGS